MGVNFFTRQRTSNLRTEEIDTKVTYFQIYSWNKTLMKKAKFQIIRKKVHISFKMNS